MNFSVLLHFTHLGKSVKDDKYELYSFASHEGIIKSFVIERFEVELAEILE
jgi:hypothetical protein